MERKKYLLCPQCGVHRFYIRPEAEDPVYFHVDWESNPFPTENTKVDLAHYDLSEILCCGCSWKGAPRKLVKVFNG